MTEILNRVRCLWQFLQICLRGDGRWFCNPCASHPWRIWQFWDDVCYRVFANFLLEINIFCDCWSVSEGEPVPTCEVAHENRNVVTLYHTDNKPTMWGSMEAWWLEWQSRWSLSCWPVGVQLCGHRQCDYMPSFCELAHRRLPSGGLTQIATPNKGVTDSRFINLTTTCTCSRSDSRIRSFPMGFCRSRLCHRTCSSFLFQNLFDSGACASAFWCYALPHTSSRACGASSTSHPLVRPFDGVIDGRCLFIFWDQCSVVVILVLKKQRFLFAIFVEDIAFRSGPEHVDGFIKSESGGHDFKSTSPRSWLCQMVEICLEVFVRDLLILLLGVASVPMSFIGVAILSEVSHCLDSTLQGAFYDALFCKTLAERSK